MRLFQINPLFIFLLSLPFCAVAAPRKQHAFIEVDIPDTETHCTNTKPSDWALITYAEQPNCVGPSVYIRKEGCVPQEIVSFYFNTPSTQIMVCIYEDTECKKPIGGWSGGPVCHNLDPKGLAAKVVPMISEC